MGTADGLVLFSTVHRIGPMGSKFLTHGRFQDAIESGKMVDTWQDHAPFCGGWPIAFRTPAYHTQYIVTVDE